MWVSGVEVFWVGIFYNFRVFWYNNSTIVVESEYSFQIYTLNVYCIL